MTGTAQEEGRGPFELIRDRDFGPFVLGKFISSCGIWIQNLAAAVLAFELTGSALAVGFVSFLQFLPSLVFTLWTGQLADRYSRRLLLMTGRLVSGVTVTTLGILIVSESMTDDLLLTAVYVFVFIMGLGLSISAPSMQAIVPGLVPPKDLEAAVALGAAAPSFARAIGPAVGAAVLLASGPGWAFIIAGMGHLLFATALTVVRATEPGSSGQSVALLGGLRYVVRNPRVGALIVGVALMSFGSDPVITLTPSLAESIGADTSAVGVLTAMFGLGAITQAFTIRAIRRRIDLATTSTLAFVGLVISLITLALSDDILTASIGFFVGGLTFMVANVSLTTQVHALVDDAFRGRVLALWSIAFLGARPVVAVTNGFITDRIGLRAGFLTAAVVVALTFPLVRTGFRRDP